MNKMKRLLSIFSLALTIHVAADIGWSEPQTLSTDMVNASDPQVVMDANGNSTAVWIENGQLLASRKLSTDMMYGTSTTISGMGSVSNISPKLGVDGNGNVTALWIADGVATANTFNGSWTGTTPLSGNLVGTASNPDLAVDSFGNVVAVWQQTNTQTYIQSAFKLAGSSTWSGNTQISSDGTEDFPSVAIGGNGTVVAAAWHTQANGFDGIIGATASITMTQVAWNSENYISSAVSPIHNHYPHIAVDSKGNATTVWFQYELSGSQAYNVTPVAASLSSTLITQQNWSTPTTIGLPSLRDPADLMMRISYDSNGNAFVIWTSSFDGTTFNVETAVQQFNKPWVTDLTVWVGNPIDYGADGAVATYGDTVIGYVIFDGTSLITEATETDITSIQLGSFTVPFTLPLSGNNNNPKVAISDTYDSMAMQDTINGAVVWINSDGTTNSIQASTGTKTKLLPPKNVQAMQMSTTPSLGVYNNFFNQISWTASDSSNIFGYALYRNGIFFTTVSSNTTEFNDNNAVEGESVVYGVATIDNEFFQSRIETANPFP